MLGEKLSAAAVDSWLRECLPEACPPWSCERISGGYSMLTYRLSDRDGRAWVVRLPPASERSGRAHDTDREARVMSALDATEVPVPRVRAVGSPSDPLGVPCHITDFVDGYVLGDLETAQRHLKPESLHEASIDIVSVLARLHSVDPDKIGLGDFGPRANYVDRQMHRWRAVIADAAAPDQSRLVDDLVEIAATLETNTPRSGALRIVHGDYRLGNAIVDEHGRIQAVLDWELATLGEPLADLGLLAAFWSPPTHAMLGVRMPTATADAIDIQSALTQYADSTGVVMTDFWFYQAFSAWRLACTALRAHKRYKSGSMGDDADTSKFLSACAAWVSSAQDQLDAR